MVRALNEVMRSRAGAHIGEQEEQLEKARSGVVVMIIVGAVLARRERWIEPEGDRDQGRAAAEISLSDCAIGSCEDQVLDHRQSNDIGSTPRVAPLVAWNVVLANADVPAWIETIGRGREHEPSDVCEVIRRQPQWKPRKPVPPQRFHDLRDLLGCHESRLWQSDGGLPDSSKPPITVVECSVRALIADLPETRPSKRCLPILHRFDDQMLEHAHGFNPLVSEPVGDPADSWKPK